MAKFKDAREREWEITLTTGMLGKLRRDANFTLTKVGAAKQLTELMDDPMMFGAVLWVLIEDQAKGKVEPEDFAMALDGDTIERATDAFMGACVDFFQRAGTREAIKAKLPAMLARVDQEVIAAAEKIADEALKKPVGSLLESPALTPQA